MNCWVENKNDIILHPRAVVLSFEEPIRKGLKIRNYPDSLAFLL